MYTYKQLRLHKLHCLGGGGWVGRNRVHPPPAVVFLQWCGLVTLQYIQYLRHSAALTKLEKLLSNIFRQLMYKCTALRTFVSHESALVKKCILQQCLLCESIYRLFLLILCKINALHVLHVQ